MTRRVARVVGPIGAGRRGAAFGVWSSTTDALLGYDAAPVRAASSLGMTLAAGLSRQVARRRAGTGLARWRAPGRSTGLAGDARPARRGRRRVRHRALGRTAVVLAQRPVDPRGGRHRRSPDVTVEVPASSTRSAAVGLIAAGSATQSRPTLVARRLRGLVRCWRCRGWPGWCCGSATAQSQASPRGRQRRAPSEARPSRPRDRAAARGAGPAGARRARRRRPLARGDPGPGRVGAVPRGRRHPAAQADHGEHRDVGPHVAAGRAARAASATDRRPSRAPAASTPGRGRARERPRGGRRARSARPQPLPPELDVVAYRVLQEMLTNAIKHGRRDEPVVRRAALGGRAADRGAQRRSTPAPRGRSPAAARGSTGCAGGSSRSAAARRTPPRGGRRADVHRHGVGAGAAAMSRRRSGCCWSTTRSCSARASR